MTRHIKILLIIGAILSITAAAVWLEQRSDSVRSDAAVLNLRLESFSLGLDPANILDTQSRRIIDMLHARLLGMTHAGEPQPEIAARWSWTTPLTLVLHLKPKLTFSTGEPIRPQDVAWSLCRHLQPAAVFRWLFSNIEHQRVDEKTVRCSGITIPDATSIQISVKHSPERLLRALASSMGAVIPENATAGEYSNVTGAGPYKLARIDANAAVILAPHHGGPITPGAAGVVLRYISDDAAAVAQFRAGTLDVLEVGNPRILAMAAGISTDAGARSIEAETHQVRLVLVNLARLGSGSDDHVGARRQLLWLQGAVKSAPLPGIYGRLGQPLPTAYFPARKLVQAMPVAPTQASAPRRRLQLITENDPYSEQIAAAITAAAGNDTLSYITLDKSILIDRLIKRDYDTASISLEALVNDPVYWLSFFRPGSPFTVFGESIGSLEQLEPTTATLQQIANAIDGQGNWIPLFQERRQYLFASSVSGERILPTGLIDYSRMTKQQ